MQKRSDGKRNPSDPYYTRRRRPAQGTETPPAGRSLLPTLSFLKPDARLQRVVESVPLADEGRVHGDGSEGEADAARRPRARVAVNLSEAQPQGVEEQLLFDAVAELSTRRDIRRDDAPQQRRFQGDAKAEFGFWRFRPAGPFRLADDVAGRGADGERVRQPQEDAQIHRIAAARGAVIVLFIGFVKGAIDLHGPNRAAHPHAHQAAAAVAGDVAGRAYRDVALQLYFAGEGGLRALVHIDAAVDEIAGADGTDGRPGDEARAQLGVAFKFELGHFVGILYELLKIG